MAADDFIFHYGEDEFRRFVNHAMSPPPPLRSLNAYRVNLEKTRLESVGHPGIYLDVSPTGAGKTHADLPAVVTAKTSLTVLPTHKHCRNVKETYSQSGLDTEAYPELNTKTCQDYDKAARAIDSGLSASAAVCPTCWFKNNCDYRSTLESAESADHRIATHQRARMSMEGLAEGRHYIAIHENPVDLLRPMEEINSGLERVAEIARAAKDTARDRNDMDLYWFLGRMEDKAHWLIEQLQQADNTTPLDAPANVGTPRLADARLYAAMQSQGVYPAAGPMRIVKALAAGGLAEIIVRVDRVLAPRCQTVVKKSIIAVWQTRLPENVPVWLCDATADAEEIELLVGRPVVNMTPEGRLEQQHTALQVPVDVKQSTVAGTVVKLLQGFLTAFPKPQKIGIICHRTHVSTIRGTAYNGPVLDEACRNRISKVEYFHGGESCGSNQWLDECDIILVFGTPRVPPRAVKSRLIQTGRPAAAARDGQWERDYWSGVTTTSKRRTVRTSAYRDHDWHAAHVALVRSELLQAIGRGRGICPNGVPVVVFSNEPLGLPLAEMDIELLSETAVRVLREVMRLGATNPKGESLGKLEATNPIYILLEPVASTSLAASLGIPERTIKWNLNKLLRRGLVEKVGDRGGWKLMAEGMQFILPTPQQQDTPAAAAGCIPVSASPIFG